MLFPASTPLSFAVFAPLARALAADPRVAVVVSARHGGRALARSCLDFPFSYLPGLLARWARFDAAVCPGFFFRSRRAGRLIEMFHGVSPKNYAVRDEVARFDRLFLIGEYHRRKFVRAGLLAEDDPRGVQIGMPKTDRLLVPDAACAAFLESLDLDRSRPVVVYAPTRSGSAGSSLDQGGFDLVDRMARLPVNLLVKLHDRSLRRYRDKLAVDYEQGFAAREAAGRLRLVRHHDIIPLLLAADVLVSDLSSVASEFLLRDRPIVFLAVPGHEERIRQGSARRFGVGDPEDLDYLRAAGEVVPPGGDPCAALERALADPGARSAARRERAELLFYNPGRATSRALAALYETIELNAP